MTEQEAKTKWCPVATRMTDGGFLVHIDSEGDRGSNCIASECMWWVWDYQDMDPEFTPQDEGHCGATND